ncbi:hypothetical protein LVB77_20570 [Lysobacter sp. 5GHs7-4]|uniref:tetratricopeptide repeat protein n=1 Tax=Lysobacter sp. 5GHs7-4 TaxID=2904253 RepID=UPI001E2F06F0|nr:hypothetical protein [Lysobacter sp. 5GHs7-4]UHQ23009.1 hypothetical protein LVB77_20570 [Lysobacter sp. 5GHs7-4]
MIRYTPLRPRLAALVLTTLLFATPLAAAPLDPGGEMNALYWQGHSALGAGDWKLAQLRFADLERRLRQNEPSTVDAAVYWQAYALMRGGRDQEAAALVRRLRSEFPRSRWNRDAAMLLHGKGRPAAVDGEDSLTGMLQEPPAQAIPKLVGILNGSGAPRLKQRALFLLSQMDDAGALAQVAAVARGKDRALSERAVRMLAVANAGDELRQVYAAVPEPQRKLLVLKAMGVAGSYEDLAEVARHSTEPHLRAGALQALGVAGQSEVLAEVANSSVDAGTRIAAIQALGTANATRDLLALYPNVRGAPLLRQEVLKSLLVASNEGVVMKLYHQATSADEQRAVQRVLLDAGYDPNRPRR